MERKSEIEQLLFDEIQEKKRTGRGIHSKTGKRGYTGRLRFPYETGTRAEKIAYKKAGKVTVTNLYDEILKRADFEALEDEEQRNRIKHWRTKYTVKQIQTGLGMASATYYGHLQRLGIPNMRKSKRKPGPKTTKEKSIAIESAAAAELVEKKPILTALAPPTASPPLRMEQLRLPLLNGLNIGYNGTYKAEAIRKILNKLDIILDDETAEYEIQLKITEKQKG